MKLVYSFLLFAVASLTLPFSASGDGSQQRAQIDRGMGPCSAKFVVVETSLDPVSDAIISAEIRRSAASKPEKIEVRTDSQGTAILQGLPRSKRPIHARIAFGDRVSEAVVDTGKQCHGTYKVVLSDLHNSRER
jgi:hypothetical protein